MKARADSGMGCRGVPGRGEVWSAAHALRWPLEGEALSGQAESLRGCSPLDGRCTANTGRKRSRPVTTALRGSDRAAGRNLAAHGNPTTSAENRASYGSSRGCQAVDVAPGHKCLASATRALAGYQQATSGQQPATFERTKHDYPNARARLRACGKPGGEARALPNH